MKRLEHCTGIHVSPDVRKCCELNQIPILLTQLASEESVVRLHALGKIVDQIGIVQMQLCRAEQFSELLDRLGLLLQNLLSKEAEFAFAIIELLSTQRFDMIADERNKLDLLFKQKQLGQLMKDAFLNEQTPAIIKESTAFSISEWEIIDDEDDQCFKQILDFLLEKLRNEEERLLIQPYDIENEIKRNKYGFRTLDAILDALCVYGIQNQFQEAVANRGGIDIGRRYLNHQSLRIQISSTFLFGIIGNQEIGAAYRLNNDCLSIMNDIISPPSVKVVTPPHLLHISPHNHISNLHSGWIDSAQMCVNCDLMPSSTPTHNSFDMEYQDDEILQQSLWTIYDLLKKINEFLNEEKEEKTQKKLENEEADVSVQCEECRQMVSFGRFILHMKTHDALVDIHYESDVVNEDINNVNEGESDNPKIAQKRVLEDFEEEGLFEITQSQIYQEKLNKMHAARAIYRVTLNNHKYK
ncbi:MAG: hypothetical protein EZS28_005520 [Streblomastix strix]|uniref:Uncharacterized protein n=1 Tax=Streblomastix strix TaxID=222440 RepID=A0A5J4WV81_9EUKA|nr:MAG: hypothetical protein EZS28_005520 [Streblomastix strix]